MLKRHLTLNQFLARRLLVSTVSVLVLFCIAGEVYARHLTESRELARLEAVLNAFGTAIKGDLEAGDIFAARKTAESGLKTNQFKRFRVDDIPLNETLISIPANQSNEVRRVFQQSKIIESNDGHSSWRLTVENQDDVFSNQLQIFRLAALSMILGVILTLAVFSQRTAQILGTEIMELRRLIQEVGNTTREDKPLPKVHLVFAESQSAGEAASRASKTISESMIANQELAKEAAFGGIAKSVAHDIRSPLSALNMLTGLLNDIPEEQKHLMRAAIARINNIADSLLQRSKKSSLPANETAKRAELVPNLLALAISEKQLELGQASPATIELTIASDALDAFIETNADSFIRAISNLLNNSVEANASKIEITLTRTHSGVTLQISDNGKGIPESIVSKLNTSNLSFGKEQGHGLGLLSAKKVALLSGGNFSIESKDGSGTLVVVSFQQSERPSWMWDLSAIRSARRLVIVDDDPSIPILWRRISTSMKLNVSIVHLVSLDEFELWSSSKLEGGDLILMDYNFQNDKRTGLDVIVKHELVANAVIITARTLDHEFIDLVRATNARLFPKSMIARI